MGVLEWLLDAIFPPRLSERSVREISPDALHQLVSGTHIQTHELPIVALLPYKSPLVQAVVTEAKFHGNTRAQELLGSILREYLLEMHSEEAGLANALVVIPVPLSAVRKRERGYNQVETICMAALRDIQDMSLRTDFLSRTRDTLPQTSLSRADRITNMQGAFISTPLDSSTTYVVVDDVTTTGATLQDATRALRDAGATHVIALALAH